MSLLQPRYIAAARIADAHADYPWDEWNVKDAYLPPDEELLERYGDLTHRAQVAMTVATAEWIVFRFNNLSSDPMPMQYLEAAWAANVDLAYGTYIETDDDDWRGPVRGPLNVAISIVVDALFCADQTDDPAENPAWMSKLAERVLPEHAQASFKAWRLACLERLEKYYSDPLADESLDADDDLDEIDDLFAERTDQGGPPVPREAFDPTFDFKPERVTQLIGDYLAALDPSKNEFLQSADQMREQGFVGTPYTYPPS